MRKITAMFNVLLIVVLLTSVLTSTILAEDMPIYALLGEEIVLVPEPFSETLTRIVWKHGDDKAAEWEDGAFDYYRNFAGRTKLSPRDGTMTLEKLEASFSGIYSAEINGKQASKKSELRVIGRVPPPNISKECKTHTECTLYCKGADNTHGRYAWARDDGKLLSSSSSLTIPSNEQYDRVYTCNHSNPLSFALGELVPFPKPPPPIGLIVAIVIGIVAVAVCAGLARRFKEKLPCLKKKTGDQNTGAKDAEKSEGTPLNADPEKADNADPEKADNDDKGTTPNADPEKADNADPEKADNDDKGTTPNGPEAEDETPL